jgi:hypothetical protein
MSATSSCDMQEIIEDVITAPNQAALLRFKSEYEFLTSKSLLNGNLIMLELNADIVNKVIKYCSDAYGMRPIICFLDEFQQVAMQSRP